MITGEEQVRERLSSLYGEINSYLGRPSNSHQQLAGTLQRRVSEATRRTQELLGGLGMPTRAEVEAGLRSTSK